MRIVVRGADPGEHVCGAAEGLLELCDQLVLLGTEGFDFGVDITFASSI